MKFYYSNFGVTLCLVRDIRKKIPAEDCPLKWRVTYKRKQVYYSSGFVMNEKTWNRFTKASESDFNFKTKALDLKGTKDSLSKHYSLLEKRINELASRNDFSFERLHKDVGRSDIKTLNDAFREKINTLEEDNNVNYADSFKYTLNSLEKWKGKSIQFNDITVSFLKNYEKHLLDAGKSKTTVGYYTRNIRTIINGDGDPFILPKDYPFGRGKYVIPKSGKREKALELEEIHLIHRYNCTGETELYRDMWLFSFYGNGMNMTDICRLKYANIKNGEIIFVRKKTANTRREEAIIHIPILEPIKEIIEKHANKLQGGYLFPFINDKMTEKQKVRKISDIIKKINTTIKAIADDLRLPDNISTYTTRHSFVTILERLGVPTVYVKNSLGHTTESVTDNYSGAFERELRYKYNSLLLPKSEKEIVDDLIKKVKSELILS